MEVRNVIRTLAALALAVTLGACAAATQPMGTPVGSPQIAHAALVAADGYELPLRVWMPYDQPVRAVVVALHGFNDYSNAFETAGKRFARDGVATYAYDQRGFGRTRGAGVWAGGDTLIADAKTAVELVRSEHPNVPLYLMGESMGGAVVLAALTDANAPKVDGAILVAPAVWGKETMGFLPRAALWVSYNLLPGMTVTAPRELDIKPSDNVEMLRAFSRDPLVIKGTRVDAVHGLTELMGRALTATTRLDTPALVLYGANEQVLPPKPVTRAIAGFEAGGRHVVAVYPDGYHMLLRDLKGEVVMSDIVGWIGSPSAPLASGADRGPRALVAAK